jgi:hypothetical protein
MFVDVKDLRFCMETGKLWEPPHLSSSDTINSSEQSPEESQNEAPGVCLNFFVFHLKGVSSYTAGLESQT